jgi:type I restriction enzyme R subunit
MNDDSILCFLCGRGNAGWPSALTRKRWQFLHRHSTHRIETGVHALSLGEKAHEQLHAALNPAKDRFKVLDADEQEEFRDALHRFINSYRFLAQVVTFTDVNLERDYLYCKALDAVLPGQESERLDLGSEVKLTHLRVEQTYEGSAALKTGGVI